MADEPGRLLASGRAADVYDLGDGTVVRRYRTPHDCGLEARVMTWLADAGIRVPRVHSAAGGDIVMSRVDGETMLDDIRARPWRVVRHARLLASLQSSVNALTAPDWVPHPDGVPTGDRVVHLDLHPMNVMLAADGPVIIDWTNVARGDPGFDAAMSYVLMASVEVNGLEERLGRRVMVESFRRARGRATIRSALPAAVAYRLGDRNVTDGERVALQRMLDRTGGAST